MLESPVRRLFQGSSDEAAYSPALAAHTAHAFQAVLSDVSSPSLCPSPLSPLSPPSPAHRQFSPASHTPSPSHTRPDAPPTARQSAPPASSIVLTPPAHSHQGHDSSAPLSPHIRYSAPRDPDTRSRARHSSVRYGTPDPDDDALLSTPRLGQAGSLTPASSDRACRVGRGGLLSAGYHTQRPVQYGRDTCHKVESSPVEKLVQELQAGFHSAVQVSSAKRSSRLSASMRTADDELDQQLASISGKLRDKELELLQADERLTAKHFQERSRRLEELQRSHEKASAEQRQQVEQMQKRAEAERREAEAAAEAARAREQAEAARKQQEQQEKQRQQQQQQQQQQQEERQKKEAEARAQASKQAAPPAATGVKPPAEKVDAATRCMRASPHALEQEQQMGKRLKELEESFKAITENDALKKQRRDVEKKMTVHVQQISATTEQVGRKVRDVYQLITSQQDPLWLNYAMYMFAVKIVNQWELIMLNNKAAYPLSTVIVKISTQYPDLLFMAVALMHRECCFAVPLAFVLKDNASGAQLSPSQQRRLMGYKEHSPDPSKPEVKAFESEDAFVQRIDGTMTLYGAIVQVDEPRNPFGLDQAWCWLARFLNHLPASRASAKALISFLRPAGFSMYHRFRGQFVKVLRVMHDEFLADLAHSRESDVQAVCTLLAHYLQNAQYTKEPEGRAMPKIDESTYLRA